MANPFLKWRISTSEAGLAKGLFFIIGLPPPSLFTYQPFSKIVGRSDGGDAAHGYKKLTIIWDTISLPAYSRLRTLVDSVRPGLIYITFEIGDGSLAGGFVDASGHPGFLQQSINSPANRVGTAAVSNAQLVINNLTIINSPSNYS